MAPEHFDILIVGAGLSGIGAGAHLKRRLPHKTYAILEGRDAIGGTWDLFRYPGVRSDSDMYTLGYAFKPWTNAQSIAEGPAILDYVKETAREYDVERHIRFKHKVKRAAWDSQAALWTVEADHENQIHRFTCSFLLMCAGYYDIEQGYLPHWEGVDRFNGRVVHPQNWPEDLDYAGKRVVVIGSGATAVTLAPEMAKRAAHVVMLQRSPTYVVSRPAQDPIANRLKRFLPRHVAYGMTRWKNVLMQSWFYNLARRKPARVKSHLIHLVQNELGPDYDVATHFTPRYDPWDQRLCLVPDSDLFNAIKLGRASVVTDQIETFTEHGLKLKSGADLSADIIVAATGLNLVILGGTELAVDGAPVDLATRLTYKGMMFEGVPNLASVFGYTNASWTLKADLTCAYVCRLISYMDARGLKQVRPRNADPNIPRLPWLDFSSGYITRAMARFPKQGAEAPWRVHQNYFRDLRLLRHGRIDDGVLDFSSPRAAADAKAAA
ncbi:MAG: NAD(P)/FAD-dependent oxidoreductase [Hyphomonadaceae bacterium]|nr:NAD(P)/FAD-dependent oxidoreductase [Hyphomonadaceae bacterium]